MAIDIDFKQQWVECLLLISERCTADLIASWSRVLMSNASGCPQPALKLLQTSQNACKQSVHISTQLVTHGHGNSFL